MGDGHSFPFDTNYGLNNCTSILLLSDADGMSLIPLRISMKAQQTCVIYTMLELGYFAPIFIHPDRPLTESILLNSPIEWQS